MTVRLHWLEGVPAPSTWGTPWPRGTVPADQEFRLTVADGSPVPVQSWPLAFWPDGSLKWTAHAVSDPADSYTLGFGPPASPSRPVAVVETASFVDVDNGVLQLRIPRGGRELIGSIRRDGVEIARGAALVSFRQAYTLGPRERLDSDIHRVVVEQAGPIRAVVRIEGTHSGWLPFIIRIYVYASAEHLRIMHSFVYDHDGAESSIAGLGVRFRVPMRDALHDRHIRFVGSHDGMLTEAVQGVTGLRRGPGPAVRAAQVAGSKLPPQSLRYVPAWGDYTLSQLSSEGFTLRKRTRRGFGWVPVDEGRRAAGLAYVGGVTGGLAFGLRDFWQRHPTRLDIRDANTGEASATVWLWAPEAGPMDLRPYHDGLGQETFSQQLDGLDVTYEDHEPGFGTPYGIARTSELMLWVLPATPPSSRFAAMAAELRTPPQLVNPTSHLVACGVFGGLFSPVDRSQSARAAIEDHLDFLFGYYQRQVDQRHWYGFWNHGDIMHTFDEDRLVWRYDIGGYAWDNSELSPDLWLWYAFLRSGRADIFRFAEAMTRHTGEVDVYHLGRWAGLGTRHGVQHWSDSAKQHRISTALYRRIYYYLTGDERTGDLLSELIDAERTFLVLDPVRKIRTDAYTPDRRALWVDLGTDWSGLVAAWLTEWERRGPHAGAARSKLLGTMETIAAMPNGFVTGRGLYNMDSPGFGPVADKVVDVSHLSAVFGLVEVCAELLDLVDHPGFERAWLQYCRLYNAAPAEQAEECGAEFGPLILRQAHARLTAYAAARLGRADLATRAWHEFYNGDGYGPDLPWTSEPVTSTLNPTEAAPWVSTNLTAQYALAAIQCLALTLQVAER